MWRPLGNRIIGQALGHNVSPNLATSQLIKLPERYEPDPVVWRVLSVGPGKLRGDGTRETIGCEVGWRVVCKAITWGCAEVDWFGVKARVIPWDIVELVLPP